MAKMEHSKEAKKREILAMFCKLDKSAEITSA